MFYAILGSLILVSIVQKDKPNRLLACFYSMSILLHDLIFGGINHSMYYISASLFDALIILMILLYFAGQSISIGLLYVCVASIIINFVGSVLWLTGFSPIIYNNLFIIIYCVAIMVLIREGVDGGNIAFNSSNSAFYRASCPCPGSYMET